MTPGDRRQSSAGGLTSTLTKASSGGLRNGKSNLESGVRLLGRPSGAIVIKEGGASAARKEEQIIGKGKGVVGGVTNKTFLEDANIKGMFDPEASSSSGLVLKVNKFVGNQEDAEFTQINRNLEGNFDKNSVMGKDDAGENANAKSIGEEEVIANTNFVSAWRRPQHIKVSINNNMVDMSDDGVAIKLNAELQESNAKILTNSLVVKVLGNNTPFSVCSVELRRQWGKFGNFHLTTIGMNWILCSFKSSEAMEEVLSGGPWYVGGHIVGMDRWAPTFSPNSFKGITAPVWIRFPCLPLFCWDEDSIIRIASRIGTPMYLDGNSFKWGKREYVRVCVRLNLENKLPQGVWVDGIAGRFFQNVEYEKIASFCFHCGRLGHERSRCPDDHTLAQKKQQQVNEVNSVRVDDKNPNNVQHDEYGPWIHVKFNNGKFRRGKMSEGDGGGQIKHKEKSVKEAVQDDTLGIRSLVQQGSNEISNNNIKVGNAAKVNDIEGTNRFKVLECETEEGEFMVKPIPTDGGVDSSGVVVEAIAIETKSLHPVVAGGKAENADVMNGVNDGVIVHVVKSKLSKEMRSLGPLEAEHRKRRGLGKGPPRGGDSSFMGD